jgi:hypothetical protein
MKTQVIEEIKKSVNKVIIKKRGTPEGDAQREAFRLRWGIKPENL